MKTNPTITAGIFTCLLLIGIYSYLIISRLIAPAAAPSTNSGASLDANLLESPVLRNLAQKNKNGSLPVVINPSEIGNANPFE